MNTMTIGTTPPPPVRGAASRGGGKLIALMLGLFVVPVLVTALLFAIDWRPAQPGHRGELIGELYLPLSGLRDDAGKPLPGELLGGRWSLVVASAGPCAAACRERLDSVRRIHVALYKQMPRVKRVWLSPAPAADAALAALRTQYPDLVVAMPDAAGGPWQALLSATPTLYVIDPSGRAVLRYGERFDARDVLRDVERLLKFSWIG